MFSITLPSALMLALVAFIGAVIVRFSRRYLAGQPGLRAYWGWLAATFAAVAFVIVSNHLLVLTLAWMATSLAVHRLLLFFGDRPAAQGAARKKFVLGRLADGAMFAAVLLLASSMGTLYIDELGARAAEMPPLAQAAVVLVALAAVLKCAQLPFHGWLIQVMEAPTPVSALLHAGVVNLGGFVLIRLAPLVAEVPLAQGLLVVAGTFSAVVGALVMTTRISVKVALAWSTAAQMGFMLLQCGLGAWEMALVHLVAHSLYKAHAFLGAGGVVRAAQVSQLAPPPPAATLRLQLGGALIGIAATALAALLWGVPLLDDPRTAVLAGIVALALVPLARPGWLTLAAPFALACAWFALHALAAGSVVPVALAPAPAALWVFAALGFAGLFGVQCALSANPAGALARRLYPWFYGGLFLDERLWRMGGRKA